MSRDTVLVVGQNSAKNQTIKIVTLTWRLSARVVIYSYRCCKNSCTGLHIKQLNVKFNLIWTKTEKAGACFCDWVYSKSIDIFLRIFDNIDTHTQTLSISETVRNRNFLSVLYCIVTKTALLF